MYWAFAIVNNHLAEIYYETKRGKSHVVAHCLVKASEYKTQKEQLLIARDITKFHFTWKHGVYTALKK